MQRQDIGTPTKAETPRGRARLVRTALIVASLCSLAGGTARAQYYYPGGYGGYGWRGWGGGGTVYGDMARGMGWYAMGQGVYNVDTAQANAINANTAMRMNEYLYECLSNRQRILSAHKKAEILKNRNAYNSIQDRIRNDPSADDINSGDALNLAMVELTDPKYSSSAFRVASSMMVDSDLIRAIPFQNAVDAVTLGINELSDSNPPEVFKDPIFVADVKAYRELIDEIDKQALDEQKVDAEKVAKLRALLKDAASRVKGMTELPRPKQLEAERYLKALLGLSYMLDGPSLDIYLAGLEDHKEVSLAELLGFMQSFNLRFGVAENPAQKQAYSRLYAMLSQVRDELFPDGNGTLPSDGSQIANGHSRSTDFFSGMKLDELDPHANRAKAANKPPKPANP